MTERVIYRVEERNGRFVAVMIQDGVERVASTHDNLEQAEAVLQLWREHNALLGGGKDEPWRGVQ